MNICKCRSCGSENTDVIDSRKRNGSIYRRRKCRVRGERWSTQEITEEDALILIELRKQIVNLSILFDKCEDAIKTMMKEENTENEQEENEDEQ